MNKSRKANRLKEFDYNSAGVYFLTICTEDRKCLLSTVKNSNIESTQITAGTGSRQDFTVLPAGIGSRQDSTIPSVGTGVPDGPYIELTYYGRIADKYINQISNFYDDISVDAYVIMPNHIHILLNVKDLRYLRTVEDASPYEQEKKCSRTVEDASPYEQRECEQQLSTRTKEHIFQITDRSISPQNTVTARFVSVFKRFCNKEYGKNIWQFRSHDHIIRDKRDYDARMEYIYKNPMNWYYDELYSP